MFEVLHMGDTSSESNEVCRVNACIVTANSHLYMFGGMNPHLDYTLSAELHKICC